MKFSTCAFTVFAVLTGLFAPGHSQTSPSVFSTADPIHMSSNVPISTSHPDTTSTSKNTPEVWTTPSASTARSTTRTPEISTARSTTHAPEISTARFTTTSPAISTISTSFRPSTTTPRSLVSSTTSPKFYVPIPRSKTSESVVKTKRRMRDCGEVLLAGYTTTGAYKIYPFAGSSKGVYVRCDMDTDGGGWTVLETRNIRGVERESFNLSMSSFTGDGFGPTCGDAFIGMPALVALTSKNDQQVKLSQIYYHAWVWNAQCAGYVEYWSYFRYFQMIQTPGSYQLMLSTYQAGNLGDISANMNGTQFYAKDTWSRNCANKTFAGAGWYKNCVEQWGLEDALQPNGYWGNEIKIRNPFLKWNTSLSELTIILARYRRIPRDCMEILFSGNTATGVYKIYPDQTTTFVHVYCDMTTDGGGWTTIMQRGKYAVEREDFSSYTWAEYETGFGSTCGDLMMGFSTLHTLLLSRDQSLRVDLTDWEGSTAVAKYGSFWLGGVSESYELHVSNYSGTAGDSLSPHNGFGLTTSDRDNDDWDGGNCAEELGGAWWYANCVNSNLNGEYLNKSQFSIGRGMIWSAWKGYNYSIKSAEMRIRNANFSTLKAMFAAV